MSSKRDHHTWQSANYRVTDASSERPSQAMTAFPQYSNGIFYSPSFDSGLAPPPSLMSYMAFGNLNMPHPSVLPSTTVYQQQPQLQTQLTPLSMQDENSNSNDEPPSVSQKFTTQCDFCLKSFHCKAHFERHMVIHEQDASRHFKCAYCNATFKNSGSKKGHEASCGRKNIEVDCHAHAGQQPHSSNSESTRAGSRYAKANNSNKKVRLDRNSETASVTSKAKENDVHIEIIPEHATQAESRSTRARIREKLVERAEQEKLSLQSPRRIRFGLDAAKPDAPDNSTPKAATSLLEITAPGNVVRFPNTDCTQLKQMVELVDACLEILSSDQNEAASQVHDLKSATRLAVRTILQQNVLMPLMSALAGVTGYNTASIVQGLSVVPANVAVADVIDGLEAFKVVCGVVGKLAVPEVLGRALVKPAMMMLLSIVASVIHIVGAQ